MLVLESHDLSNRTRDVVLLRPAQVILKACYDGLPLRLLIQQRIYLQIKGIAISTPVQIAVEGADIVDASGKRADVWGINSIPTSRAYSCRITDLPRKSTVEWTSR